MEARSPVYRFSHRSDTESQMQLNRYQPSFYIVAGLNQLRHKLGSVTVTLLTSAGRVIVRSR